MAKATAPAAPAVAAAPSAPPKKSGKLLIIVGGLVALLAAGGAGGWWWYSQRASAAPAAEAKAAAPKAPIFINLEPFTVNLLEENGDHYLQVAVVYQVSDDKVTELLKTYMPVLRSRILLMLSSKRPSEISSPEGKTKLVADLVTAARESVPGLTPERGISQAFLAAFVIQ
jgi:flagellar FliL protein